MLQQLESCSMNLLSKLSSSFYGASPEQTKRAVTILQGGVDRVAAAFNGEAIDDGLF
jgi:hypothetical protein